MYNVERAPPTTIEKSLYENVDQYVEHDTMPSHFSMQHKRALQLKALSYKLVH